MKETEWQRTFSLWRASVPSGLPHPPPSPYRNGSHVSYYKSDGNTQIFLQLCPSPARNRDSLVQKGHGHWWTLHGAILCYALPPRWSLRFPLCRQSKWGTVWLKFFPKMAQLTGDTLASWLSGLWLIAWWFEMGWWAILWYRFVGAFMITAIKSLLVRPFATMTRAEEVT